MGAATIRITENYRHDDGYLFWRGETFAVVGEAADEVEVKTVGEYVWIPRRITDTK